MKKIKTFENFKQVDWAKVEFSKFNQLSGSFSKEVTQDMFKTDAGFFIKGFTPEEFENIGKQEYKLKDNIIEVSGLKVLYYDEDGIMLLYKIDDTFDSFQINNNTITIKFKDGKKDVIDFKNPEKKFESIEIADNKLYQEVDKEEWLSDDLEYIDFPEDEELDLQRLFPTMKFRRDWFDKEKSLHFISGRDKNKDITILIEKKDDDWYFVYLAKKQLKNYYVCDQWDGLIELLKNIV